MKRIGSGWQHIAYDLGNGRVLKRRRPFFGRLAFIALCLWRVHPKAVLLTPKELRRVDRALRKSWNILKRLPPSLSELGRHVLLKDMAYELDYVTPIGHYIAAHGLEENKRVLDAYVELTHRLWKRGVADYIYNFTINNGVVSDGSVILLDLGEITDSKEEVARSLREKRWMHSYSYGWLSPELRSYFDTLAERELTEEALERYWRN